jgi:hypothetical protein
MSAIDFDEIEQMRKKITERPWDYPLGLELLAVIDNLLLNHQALINDFNSYSNELYERDVKEGRLKEEHDRI